MEWLWTWADPAADVQGKPEQGARVLVGAISSKDVSQERCLKALDCLDVLQGELECDYDSLYELLEEHASPLLETISTLPSSSTTPQPLLRYLLALPSVLSSSQPPTIILSLQVIQQDEAFQTLAELVELQEWSTSHLAPLALALHYSRRLLSEADNLQELLLSAPLSGAKTIGLGRSILGVLGQVWHRLTNTRSLDRSQSAIARRHLAGVYHSVLSRTSDLDSETARAVLKTYLDVVTRFRVNEENLAHISDALTWVAVDIAVNEKTLDPSYPAAASQLALTVRYLLRRCPSLNAIPNNSVRTFAYNLCRLLADAGYTQEEAEDTLAPLRASDKVFGCIKDAAAAQHAVLVEDSKTLAMAAAISRIDGSDTSLLHDLVHETRTRWTPVLQALGVNQPLPVEASSIVASYKMASLDLLFNLAPDLARSLAPPLPPAPYAAQANTSQTASSYSGKVYSEHEFRATRFVPGQPFYPSGSPFPLGPSRAPSRHVDDFVTPMQ